MDENSNPQPPQEEEKQKGKITIDNGVLVVTVPLTQKNAKIISKGMLIEAINTVDEYFHMLAMRRAAIEQQQAQSQKRVIDSIIKPNGEKARI